MTSFKSLKLILLFAFSSIFVSTFIISLKSKLLKAQTSKDYNIHVNNGKGDGTWRSRFFCPPGSYAKGFSVQVEADQGTGDDTALNGIDINCYTLEGQFVKRISQIGPYGNFHQSATCQGNSFIWGYRMKVEGSQGRGDDTAVNDIDNWIIIYCL